MLPVIPRSRGVRAVIVRGDCELFARVARARIPMLDRGLPLLSRSANHSGLWITVAGALVAGGGRRGQRAAIRGLGSIAVTSLVVNQAIKRVVRRPRPSLRAVPAVRHVRVAPLTTSFPSGHAASAAAFATGVTVELAPAGAPLGLLAAAVGFSRIYVGVHYPLDVLVGAGIGAGIARLTRRAWPALPARADDVPPSEDRRRLPARADGRGVTVVVNPSAGSRLGDDFAGWLRARLPQARLVLLDEGADLDHAVRDAAAGCDILGLAGGDGSIAAAARIALENDWPLLVLPGGTLNHFARDLRVERATDAVEALAGGEAAAVDVATIDGRLFLNTAGFGAYPDMLAIADRLEPRIGRWASHVVAFVRTLVGAEPLELEIDGTRRSLWMGFVGNCRHEPDGLAPSWRPRLDDGCLDVRLVRADLPFSRLRAIVAAVTGRLPRSKAYESFLVSELHVDSSQSRLRLAHDGEHVVGRGSFIAEKQRRRLIVCAPHEPSG